MIYDKPSERRQASSQSYRSEDFWLTVREKTDFKKTLKKCL